MIYESFDLRCKNVINESIPIDRSMLSRPEKRKLYDMFRAAEACIVEEFHQALSVEYGLKDHPRELLVWAKAWNGGHSGGLSEVECHYISLAHILIGPIS